MTTAQDLWKVILITFKKIWDSISFILSITVRRNDIYKKKKTCFIIIKWPWENYIISLWKIKVSQTEKSNISGFTWSFRAVPHFNTGFPSGSAVKNHLQCRRQGFNAWVGMIPWRRKCEPTSVFLPGKTHEHKSLAGYSTQGHKESDMNEATFFTSFSSWWTRMHAVSRNASQPPLILGVPLCASGDVMWYTWHCVPSNTKSCEVTALPASLSRGTLNLEIQPPFCEEQQAKCRDNL